MAGLELTTLDAAVAALVLIATARGLYIGLIRESFSIGAIALAVIVTRFATPQASAWVVDISNGQIGTVLAPWLAGAVIGMLTILLVGFAGRLIRRGIQFAGLSWADRLGGAAIGLLEGGLVALVLVLGATWMLGRAHPSIVNSRSLAAYEEVQRTVDAGTRELPDLPSVAAPGRP